MLQSLSIQNFALIDQIELDFQDNLTVITGETGAGKSILLGALGLILGNRADHSSLKDKSRKCIIEGSFFIKKYKIKAFFESHDLDYSDETILRREINKSGKSRSFINDTPVTLEVLKRLSNQLIDIHSQQQSLQINDLDFQLDVLDSLAANEGLLSKYKSTFLEYKSVKKEIAQLKKEALEAKQQEDYLNFQFQELKSLDLKKEESALLEEEQNRFANSEEILRNLSQAQHLLGENDENILSQISHLKQLIQAIENFDASFPELLKRVSSVEIELDDLLAEIQQKVEAFEYDPERHQIVEDRLSEIHRLLQKHLLSNADELIDLQESIELKLMSMSFSNERIGELEKQLVNKTNSLSELAEQLMLRRKESIKILKEKVETTLNSLGISYAKIEVQHEALEEFNSKGLDSFEFLFSANKGIPTERISKSASGGEISRLMLAIKRLLAEHKQMPTILFDEIDTGVSGDIADKMGMILAEIGRSRQIIAITHLPQLAAKGKQHYYIYKQVAEDRSVTQVKVLGLEERINEVAKMLSGTKISEAAMNNAKELLIH